VTLVPGASLRVKYAAREGYLSCRVHCDGALVAEEAVQAGGTSTLVVPSGPLVLECSFEGTSETRELDLAAGKEAELRFGDDE